MKYILLLIRLAIFVPVALLILGGTLMICIVRVGRLFEAIRTAERWINAWWLWVRGEMSTYELIR